MGWEAVIGIRLKQPKIETMTARAFLFAPAIVLTACASQTPYDEVGICLTDVSEMGALKAAVARVASRYGLTVDDYSKTASSDLAALDSPIATEHLFALILEDPRWRSEAGPVMINNIGAPSAKFVGVSMFRNDDLLGSDNNNDNLRRDLISAASTRWKIIDQPSADGTYNECAE